MFGAVFIRIKQRYCERWAEQAKDGKCACLRCCVWMRVNDIEVWLCQGVFGHFFANMRAMFIKWKVFRRSRDVWRMCGLRTSTTAPELRCGGFYFAVVQQISYMDPIAETLTIWQRICSVIMSLVKPAVCCSTSASFWNMREKVQNRPGPHRGEIRFYSSAIWEKKWWGYRRQRGPAWTQREHTGVSLNHRPQRTSLRLRLYYYNY